MDERGIRDYIARSFAGVDVEVGSKDGGAPEIAVKRLESRRLSVR